MAAFAFRFLCIESFHCARRVLGVDKVQYMRPQSGLNISFVAVQVSDRRASHMLIRLALRDASR